MAIYIDSRLVLAFVKRLVGPATSGIDFAYLNATFACGLLDYMDGVSVHPYRNGPPETAADDYASLQRIMQLIKPNASIPVVSGEWGYTTCEVRVHDGFCSWVVLMSNKEIKKFVV